jgi:hypothetical protein
MSYENMGVYRMEADNDLLPGLTLVSEALQLWAGADIEITVIGENEQLLNQGRVYALRNQGPGLAYDSIPKGENGFGDPNGLSFTNGRVTLEKIPLGDYLIAIRSDPNKYLPTYFENTYLWEEADVLALRKDSSVQMNMFVIPPPLTAADGSGLVGGSIETNFEEEDAGGRINARRKVKRAGCSMRKFVIEGGRLQEGTWDLIAYVESDDEGRFQFDFIPQGRYRFNIEYPGIPMDPDSFVEFEVGEDGRLELQATITEDGIAVVRIIPLGFSKEQPKRISVYPNPVSEQINLECDDLVGYSVKMVNMAGSILNEKWIQKMGETLTFDVSELPEGVYFMVITDSMNPKKRLTQKVIVRH